MNLARLNRALISVPKPPQTVHLSLYKSITSGKNLVAPVPSTSQLLSRKTSTFIKSAYMGDNIVNFYSGQPPLNRLSFQRQSAEKLNKHLNSKDARFVLFKDLRPLVKKGSPGELLFLSREEVDARLGGGDFQGPSAEVATSKDQSRYYEAARLPSTLPSLVFLGIDDRPQSSPQGTPAKINPLEPEGIPYFALNITPEDPQGEIESGEWGEARASAGAMTPWEAGIFAQGRALIDWNVRNRFCAACGSPTYSLWGGWKRGCITAVEGPKQGEEACFSLKGLHNFAYPRTDCVVIMGIISSDGDKILLGRQKSWPKGMYSCLAGFMEPGESFEDAVRREVLEEAGVVVGPVRYSSSQPWPYPANLMVGCFGRAEDGQTIRTDLDNELEDAQFFPRSVIAKLVGSPTGSHLSKADLRQLDAQTQTSNQETANALAPSERKPEEVSTEKNEGLTRVPPDTAIAGQLIRLWARGGIELVSKL